MADKIQRDNQLIDIEKSLNEAVNNKLKEIEKSLNEAVNNKLKQYEIFLESIAKKSDEISNDHFRKTQERLAQIDAKLQEFDNKLENTAFVHDAVMVNDADSQPNPLNQSPPTRSNPWARLMNGRGARVGTSSGGYKKTKAKKSKSKRRTRRNRRR